MGRRAGRGGGIAHVDECIAAGHAHDHLRSTRPQRWKTSAETVAPAAGVGDAGASLPGAKEISSVPLTLTKCTLARRRSGLRSRVRRGPGRFRQVVDLADDMRIADVARFPALHRRNRSTDSLHEFGDVREQARGAPRPCRPWRSRRGAHQCRARALAYPAGVDTLRWRSATPCARATAWAKQRKPLPLRAAGLPSLLNSRMTMSPSSSWLGPGGRPKIRPSAPMPVRRSHQVRRA